MDASVSKQSVQQPIYDDYCSVTPEPTSPREQAREEKGKGVVRLHSQGCRQESVGIPQVHSLLAQLAGDPSAEQILRAELLKARSFGSAGTSAKRYYTRLQSALNSAGTEVTFPLARITGGTSINTRADLDIRLYKLVIKFTFERLWTSISSAVIREPIFTFVVWRDKVPAIVGTAPTCFVSDANPPASATGVYTLLGGAVQAQFESIAQRNPYTLDQYHVYHKSHYSMIQRTGNSTSGGQVESTRLGPYEVTIPLHNLEQQYTAFAATAPCVNELYMTVVSDTNFVNMGYTVYFNFTTEVTFDDLDV